MSGSSTTRSWKSLQAVAVEFGPDPGEHLAQRPVQVGRAPSHGVRLRSVQDDSNLEDAIRVVLIGERNYEDSKREAAATKDGLRRRKERSAPIGPMPLGFRVEKP